MNFYALKIAVAAMIVLGGLLTFPLGALAAAKRTRRKYARIPLTRDLTGAAVAGILLHRENLAGRIAVEPGAATLGESYSPTAARLTLADDSARGRSVYAAATAAFLVAQVTLHADRDTDFVRAHGRRFALALTANILPPSFLFGVLVPGEGRLFLYILTPLLLCLLAGYTILSVPSERHAASRALALLERHGLVSGKSEREALRAALFARAALALAAPLTRSFWFNWSL